MPISEVQTGVGDEDYQVPADLAYCLSKLSQWDPTKGARITSYHQNPHLLEHKSSVQLPSNINEYDFEKYIQLYFNQDQTLRPFSRPLKKPVLRQSEGTHDSVQVALTASNMICNFIYGLHDTSYHRNIIGDYIIYLGLQNKDVRDEILCQLCCQTFNNSNTTASSRAWQLMAACLCCFHPSYQLFKYLLKYVSDNGLGPYKQFCQHQLLEGSKSMQESARIYPPCELEWRTVQDCARLALPITGPNQTKEMCEVKSSTKAEEVGRLMAKHCGAQHDEQSGWTISMFDHEGYFECPGQDYILDLVSECEMPPYFPYTNWTNLVTPSRRSHGDTLKDCAHSSHRKRYEAPSASASELSTRSPRDISRHTSASDDNRPAHTPIVRSGAAASHHRPVSELPRAPPLVDEDVINSLSSNRLNQRYHKKIPHTSANVDQWLDTVFNPVLDDREAKGLSANLKGSSTDAEELANRLKGGGDTLMDSETGALKRQLEAKEREAEALKKRIESISDASSPKPAAQNTDSSTEVAQNGVSTEAIIVTKPQPPTAPKPQSQTTAKSQSKVFLASGATATISTTDESIDPHTNVEVPYEGPTAAKEKAILNQVGPDGKTKVVRVGKIIWPPPQEEQVKPDVEPGKLLIQEGQNKGTLKLVGHQDVSQKIQDRIRQEREKEAAAQRAKEEEKQRKANEALLNSQKWSAASAYTAASPKADARYDRKPDDIVPIPDMKSRQFELERQLTTIYDKRDAATVTTDTLKLRSEPSPKTFSFDSYDTGVQTQENAKQQPADLRSLRNIHTYLYPPVSASFFSYGGENFTLQLRKEYMLPNERVHSRAAEDLIFAQIVSDTLSGPCIRIQKEDQSDMKHFLEKNFVTKENTKEKPSSLKQDVINTARKWPFYFSKIFAVHGGKALPTVKYLSVGHNGLFFLGRDSSDYMDQLQVIHKMELDEVKEVTLQTPQQVRIRSSEGTADQLHTKQAQALKDHIDEVVKKKPQENAHLGRRSTVIALYDYLPSDPGHLRFYKGDVITQIERDNLAAGWSYGQLNNKYGLFPSTYVTTNLPKHQPVLEDTVDDDVGLQEARKKYVLLDFALQHFRENPLSYQTVYGPHGSIRGSFRRIPNTSRTPEWQDQVKMVTWAGKPIQASLLKTDDKEMNRLAVMSNHDIMRVMGDISDVQPASYEKLYEMLLICRNNSFIRDEVYCQLMKQTEHNTSLNRESNILGWRILLLLTAWYEPSSRLSPYLSLLLQNKKNNSSEKELATMCLKHLQATQKYQGRRNVPLEEEVMFVMKGRYTKRQLVLLPGGYKAIAQISSACLVSDIVDQVCGELGVTGQLEQQEYVLFYVLEEDQKYCPLSVDEYILDVTSELTKQKKDFYLLLQRTSWVFPVADQGQALYADVIYQQVLSDWKDGYMIVIPENILTESHKNDVAMLAAIQCKVQLGAEEEFRMTQKDAQECVPRLVHHVKGMDLHKWTDLMQRKLHDIQGETQAQCKMLFLNLLSTWPLFGSTFYSVKNVGGKDFEHKNCLLAINRLGINVLDPKTHAVKKMFPYDYIAKSQRRKDNRNNLYLELYIQQPRNNGTVLIETDKVSSMISLIGQYMKIQRELKTDEDSRL